MKKFIYSILLFGVVLSPLSAFALSVSNNNTYNFSQTISGWCETDASTSIAFFNPDGTEISFYNCDPSYVGFSGFPFTSNAIYVQNGSGHYYASGTSYSFIGEDGHVGTWTAKTYSQWNAGGSITATATWEMAQGGVFTSAPTPDVFAAIGTVSSDVFGSATPYLLTAMGVFLAFYLIQKLIFFLSQKNKK